MTVPGRHRALGLVVALILIIQGIGAAGEARAAVAVQRVVAGDLEAWLVEDHTLPVIAVRVAFRGGAASDPPGKEGLAEMASGLLDEGAGDFESKAFQARIEDLAVELGFDADLDAFGGSLRTLSENRDAAFDLLRLALTRPRFDDEPIARVRSQLEAMLRRNSEDPDWVAGRRFFAQIFADHPYGRSPEGTPESLAAIGRDDLRAFVARTLTRRRLVVGVVGDVTPDALAQLLRDTFGGLPAGDAVEIGPDVVPRTGGGTVVVEMPARQSAVIFGQAGLKRIDPDFYAFDIVNHVLGGGGFTSRLFGEVREKRGLVYSVYSRPVPLDRSALLLGRAGTANERVAETVRVIRDEWALLGAKGLTESELTDAKTFLTGSFPLRFTDSRRIAETLVSMQLYDLGIDYLERRNALINQVTLDDANRVAATVLDAASLTFVVVGQPVGIGSVAAPHP
jgi:zinc protease